MCCPHKSLPGNTWSASRAKCSRLRLGIPRPVIEQTQLFKRSIGDFTDIVEKEMFSFVDQGEDHITLRPEATAGIVRAVISNGLLREGRLRVWCMGPMFRRERPQAGRYRQFHQIDAEAFGFPGPDIDAEIILLSARLLRRLDDPPSPGQFAGDTRLAPRYREQLTPISAGTGLPSTRQQTAARAIRCGYSTTRTRHAAHRRRRAAFAVLMRSRAHFESLCATCAAPASISCRAAPFGAWTTPARFSSGRRLGSQSTVCAGGRWTAWWPNWGAARA